MKTGFSDEKFNELNTRDLESKQLLKKHEK